MLCIAWHAAVTVVAFLSQKTLLMCPYVFFGVQCSHCVVLVPFGIICSLHLIAVCNMQAIWLLESIRMIPAIAIISRLLCLRGTCGLFKYFPKNTLLSFCRVPYAGPIAGWLILSSCPLAYTHDLKIFVINPSVLLQGLHRGIVW